MGVDGTRDVPDVRWRPGQEASLEPLGSFGSKCTVLKKVHVTLLGVFNAPLSIVFHLTPP